jgi:VWFA-related protein
MGVFELRKIGLAIISLAFVTFAAGGQARPQQAGQQTFAQQAIPDAPLPQPAISAGSVAPGQGSSSTEENDATPDTPAAAAPATATGSTPPSASNEPPTIEPAPGEAAEAIKTLRVGVDYVELPFTVKNGKSLVAGLHDRDIQVYENGLRQHISIFTADAAPLSVAIVIDQSMTVDEMTRVNDALGALQDAFTKYDEVSVFTYNKSTREVTDFTGAQSPRLTQAIDRSKGEGRDVPMAGSYSGPLSCTTCVNNQNFDPNTAAVRGDTSIQLSPEREAHPLNDAILAAATALSRRPLEFRRVIYVISDGKEYGSKAKTSEVIQYLETHRIEVDGTLVGDSALWGIGVLDRMHLPLMMRDNNLTPYANATGGNVDADFRIPAIEKSFARIAAEARYRYYVGYYSHEPFIDGKYRKVEVVVLNHGNNLTVLAKKGYWPAAMEIAPRTTTPTTAPTR